MRKLSTNVNVDLSDLVNYPHGRIKDNTGIGDGTPVDEKTKGDIHQAIEKLMRLYAIEANSLPDNELNGFQIVDAIRALASKNDFVLPLSLNTGVLAVPVKLGRMLENETLICKASFNLGAQTQIVGDDNVIFNILISSQFKTGEYIRLIKTSTNITLVRLSDSLNFGAIASELFFLKKATYAQEIAGLLDTVATTPQTNVLAFVERVNGASSSASLANALRNGLYPKEHFTIVANLGSSPIKNIGSFSGLDINGSTGALPVTGNIISAVASVLGANSLGHGSAKIVVTMANAMANLNYIPKMYIQSQSSNISTDVRVCFPVFKPISTTVFEVGIAETQGNVDNIKIHIEVQQL